MNGALLQPSEFENILEDEHYFKARWDDLEARDRAKIASAVETERKQPEYKRLKLKDLKVDEKYQRAVSRDRVLDIIFDFDWNLFGPLWVGDRRRSGNLYVVDGRHRMHAAAVLGIKEVWAEVRATTGSDEEARIFVALTTKRRRMNSAQQFQAKLVYNDPEALEIQKVVARHRFEIQDPDLFSGSRLTHGAKSGVIGAVGSLETVYRNHGRKGLDRVLATIRLAWDGVVPTLSSQMLRAMSGLYERHPDAEPAMVGQKLGSKDAWALIERGQRFGHSNGVPQVEAITDALEVAAGL